MLKQLFAEDEFCATQKIWHRFRGVSQQQTDKQLKARIIQQRIFCRSCNEYETDGRLTVGREDVSDGSRKSVGVNYAKDT